MKNNKIVGLVIGFILVAIIFFFIGDKYGSGSSTQTVQNAGNFAMRTGGGQRGMRGGGVFGKIIAMDATSITVQLGMPGGLNANGASSTGTGSKIVFYTGQTAIMKTIAGAISDLAVGSNVSVQGTANPDGSVNAQSISIRPAQSNAPKN